MNNASLDYWINLARYCFLEKVSSTYTMFCKNLPHDTNENEIAELFRDVLDVRVVRYPHTKKLKG